MKTAPDQPDRSIAPARKRSPAPAAAQGAAGAAIVQGAAARRTLREWLESLSLGAQFRLVVVLSVTVALLVAQAVSVVWAAWLARQDAMGFARTLPASIAAAFDQGGGADLLRNLPRHAGLLTVTLTSQSGEILSQYVRENSRGPFAARAAAASSIPADAAGGAALHRRALRFLVLEPIPVRFPVQLSPHLSASVVAVLDHRVIWNAAGRELAELPTTLAIGILLAFLAANSLKRHVVEPLAQLASATRVGNWTQGAQPQAI
ncbi:MAG: hypothetical protein L0271_21660, partial [Gemmatimonadetes bacterium]|nr:hypothetical protein [Gemmatimonadota bacterium]